MSSHRDVDAVRRFSASCLKTASSRGEFRAFFASVSMYRRFGDFGKPGEAFAHVDSANGSSPSSAPQTTP